MSEGKGQSVTYDKGQQNKSISGCWQKHYRHTEKREATKTVSVVLLVCRNFLGTQKVLCFHRKKKD